MPTLIAPPITRAAFEPYGWLIDADGVGGRPINGGNSLRVDGLTRLALDAEGGQPGLSVFRAVARDPTGPWHEMERHRLGTQTFLPMNGVRFVVLVATPGDRPETSTLAAFVVGGHQGITLRAGTWHHALIALDDGDFIVLEREAAEIDCDVVSLPEPARITLG